MWSSRNLLCNIRNDYVYCRDEVRMVPSSALCSVKYFPSLTLKSRYSREVKCCLLQIAFPVSLHLVNSAWEHFPKVELVLWLEHFLIKNTWMQTVQEPGWQRCTEANSRGELNTTQWKMLIVQPTVSRSTWIIGRKEAQGCSVNMIDTSIFFQFTIILSLPYYWKFFYNSKHAWTCRLSSKDHIVYLSTSGLSKKASEKKLSPAVKSANWGRIRSKP